MKAMPCPFTPARLQELYWREGKSLDAIARMAAQIDGAPVSQNVAARWLKEAGITTRTRAEARAVKGTRHKTAGGELQAALLAIKVAGLKYCPSCKTDKPEGDFQRDGTRKDGLSSNCKECKNERNRKNWKEHYYPAHKDALITAVQKRRQAKKTE